MLFLMLNSITEAQTLGGAALASVNNQLRYVFNPLVFQDTNVQHFYDRAGHFSDSSWWVPYNLDTTNLEVWTTVYEELWWTQNDTNQMEGIDEFYDHVNQTLPDTVDFGLFRRDFYQFIDSTVFDDSTYFHYDSINETYLDNLNRTSEPYVKERIFMMAAFRNKLHKGSIVWKINPENILIDANNEISYPWTPVGGGEFLFVDFGDGTGFHNINPDSLQYITIDYDSNGQFGARSVVVSGSGDTIDHSTVQLNVFGVDLIGSDAPDSNFTSNGMEVGIWSACDTTGGTSLGEKYIILAEGFDFLHQLSPDDMYSRYFKGTSLCELRNHGYNIVTVSWRDPGGGIESNAMRLVKLIDDLKCQLSTGDLDTLHQFVVMGESMGGVVARYALDYMEAYPYLLKCRPDLMHNTRLFVSIDAPQDGAYVPLAFQELANTVNFLSDIPASLRFRVKNYWDMLECASARDLLKLHQSTDTQGTNSTDAVYGPTPARLAMEVGFLAMKPNNEGYPEYCKTMAITRGLLTGERQLRVDGTVAQPGDTYLEGGGNLMLRVLGRTFELQNLELLLAAPDGTQNDFFVYYRGMRFWKLIIPTVQVTIGLCPFCYQLRVPNGRPRFDFDYAIATKRERFSTTCPQWDVMPGGLYNFAYITDPFVGAPLEGILPFQFGGDTINFGVTVVIPNIEGMVAFDLEFVGQLDKFNFIPVQSGIDYRIPGQPAPLEDNIYGEPTATIMARTPFNLIQGEVNGLPNYPQWVDFNDLNLPRNRYMEFPARNQNHMHRNYNHRRNDSLINSDTAFTNPLYAFFLNREIGEEELMLENFTLNRTALFEAEYIIQAGNQLNPYYDYPNQPATEIFLPFDINYDGTNPNPFNYNLQNNGIFSDENQFEVVNSIWSSNSTAVLKADSIINTTVNAGMIGPHIDLFEEQLVCILDYYCFGQTNNNDCEESNKRGADKAIAEEMEHLSVWPNPARSNESITVSTNGRYFSTVSLHDIHGRLIHTETLGDAYQTIQVQTAALHLNAGIYILSLKDGLTETIETLKIVVQ